MERFLKLCRSEEAESSEIPEGGLPSWSREARKLSVFPETFWRLQAPATAREISSWYQLTATRKSCWRGQELIIDLLVFQGTKHL